MPVWDYIYCSSFSLFQIFILLYCCWHWMMLMGETTWNFSAWCKWWTSRQKKICHGAVWVHCVWCQGHGEDDVFKLVYIMFHVYKLIHWVHYVASWWSGKMHFRFVPEVILLRHLSVTLWRKMHEVLFTQAMTDGTKIISVWVSQKSKKAVVNGL